MDGNYLAVFREGEIFAEGAIIHKGRHTALGEITVTNAQNALMAQTSATYMIMKNNESLEKLDGRR